MLPKPGHVAHAYPSSTNIEIRGEGWGGRGAILVLVLDFGIELGFGFGLAFCFWFFRTVHYVEGGSLASKIPSSVVLASRALAAREVRQNR